MVSPVWGYLENCIHFTEVRIPVGKAVALLLEATRPTTKLKMPEARDHGRDPFGLQVWMRSWAEILGGNLGYSRQICIRGSLESRAPVQARCISQKSLKTFSFQLRLLVLRLRMSSAEGWKRPPAQSPSVQRSFAPFFGCSCFSLFIWAPGTQGNLWNIHWTWAKGSEISMVTHNKPVFAKKPKTWKGSLKAKDYYDDSLSSQETKETTPATSFPREVGGSDFQTDHIITVKGPTFHGEIVGPAKKQETWFIQRNKVNWQKLCLRKSRHQTHETNHLNQTCYWT